MSGRLAREKRVLRTAFQRDTRSLQNFALTKSASGGNSVSMNDGLAVPPPPGERGGFKVPQTPGELRQAIESGKFAGEVVYEGEAKKELEQRRLAVIRAGDITGSRLHQAATDLESRVLDPDCKDNIQLKHQLMQTALAMHVVADWLRSTDHPEPRKNGAAGS